MHPKNCKLNVIMKFFMENKKYLVNNFDETGQI